MRVSSSSSCPMITLADRSECEHFVLKITKKEILRGHFGLLQISSPIVCEGIWRGKCTADRWYQRTPLNKKFPKNNVTL
jgi:hypothetical protein